MFSPNLPWTVDVQDRAFPNPVTDYHSFSVKISILLILDLLSSTLIVKIMPLYIWLDLWNVCKWKSRSFAPGELQTLT